jgi:hypothetical protein
MPEIIFSVELGRMPLAKAANLQSSIQECWSLEFGAKGLGGGGGGAGAISNRTGGSLAVCSGCQVKVELRFGRLSASNKGSRVNIQVDPLQRFKRISPVPPRRGLMIS